MITFMTTEHFVLQTARSAGISEVNGRAGFYLAAPAHPARAREWSAGRWAG